jgi:hypothetical protein
VGDNNGAMRAIAKRAASLARGGPAIASRSAWQQEPGNSGQAGVTRPISTGAHLHATYGLIGVTSAISLFILAAPPEVGNALALDKIAVLQGSGGG